MRGAFGAELGDELEATVSRFLSCLRGDRTARALGRQTLREILFHVLEGPHGAALRSLAHAHGATGQLGRVMRHIAERYAERLPVEELARLAHRR